MQARMISASKAPAVSVVIPTFNGSTRIVSCLSALTEQIRGKDAEILVVDDGSTDGTAEVVASFSGVRLIRQNNAGPAAARNHGALQARGEIVLFTDDDCVPMADWLDEMVAPFSDAEVVGAKGVYRTRQRSVVARFVQAEYEDRYRMMRRLSEIDFVDTYSAAFRRDRFLEMAGYDTSFPVACAEDIELSYRMSARGWKMVFADRAVVYHTHPDTLPKYLKKKYKFAFWRILAVRKNPGKGIKDSHTPQVMKLQLLFAPLLLVALAVDLFTRPRVPLSALVLLLFSLSTLPYAMRAFKKDPIVGVLSPFLLATRSLSQLPGVAFGLLYARSKRIEVQPNYGVGV